MRFRLSKIWARMRWYASLSKLRSTGTPKEAHAAQLLVDALLRAGVDDADEPIRVGSVKPGEPAHVLVTPHGVIVNEAEGATVHGVDGSTWITRPDGSQEISHPAVDRIEIHDLLTVSDLRINKVFQTISHTFYFCGGGTLSFVTDATGKIIEIHAKKVGYRTDKRTQVMTIYGTPLANAPTA